MLILVDLHYTLRLSLWLYSILHQYTGAAAAPLSNCFTIAIFAVYCKIKMQHFFTSYIFVTLHGFNDIKVLPCRGAHHLSNTACVSALQQDNIRIFRLQILL